MLRKPYLYILAICFFCCEEAPDFGTVDSADTPVVDIQTSETTFTEFPIKIEWEGNPAAREFIYELQFVDDPSIPHSWSGSDTTDQTSINFDNLDEGSYTFSVQGLYNQDNIGDIVTLDFTVNVISGPALRIYPLNQTAQYGDEIDVYLYFEEVPEESAVTGFHVDIQINTDELVFLSESIEQGDLIEEYKLDDGETYGQTIWPEPQFYEGYSKMSIIGVVEGNGLSGTGSLIKFSLEISQPLQIGTYGINIMAEGYEFKDMNGDQIEFSNVVSGSVTVE